MNNTRLTFIEIFKKAFSSKKFIIITFTFFVLSLIEIKIIRNGSLIGLWNWSNSEVAYFIRSLIGIDIYRWDRIFYSFISFVLCFINAVLYITFASNIIEGGSDSKRKYSILKLITITILTCIAIQYFLYHFGREILTIARFLNNHLHLNEICCNYRFYIKKVIYGFAFSIALVYSILLLQNKVKTIHLILLSIKTPILFIVLILTNLSISNTINLLLESALLFEWQYMLFDLEQKRNIALILNVKFILNIILSTAMIGLSFVTFYWFNYLSPSEIKKHKKKYQL